MELSHQKKLSLVCFLENGGEGRYETKHNFLILCFGSDVIQSTPTFVEALCYFSRAV